MDTMRYAETSSWQIRIGPAQGLLIGLFVRDAAGLRSHTDIDLPPLVPTVELRAGLALLSGPDASEQWARWWNGELHQDSENRRTFCAPDAKFGDGRELDALTRECHDDAVRWSADRCREHADMMTEGDRPDIEGNLVREVERELGRKARPFELSITELPVAGAAGWRIRPEHALVSRALWEDPAAYRQWLTPVIRELA